MISEKSPIEARIRGALPKIIMAAVGKKERRKKRKGKNEQVSIQFYNGRYQGTGFWLFRIGHYKEKISFLLRHREL